MSQPSLSIIIPTYNAASFVAEAIRSAQRQTLRDIEIIIVDDGSVDNSWEVAIRYMDDCRVCGVRQANHGIAGARNAGLAVARGEFIAFLDADDRWLRNKAARHVEHLRSDPSLDVSFSWYAVIDEFGNDTGRRGRSRGGAFTFAELLRENFVWNGQPVMRRTAMDRVGVFDATLPSHEDFEYILRLARLRDRNVACLPELLAVYRRRPGQLTTDWRAMHNGWVLALQHIRRLEPAIVARVQREATARHYRYLAYLAWEAGQYRQARAFVRRAWRAHPLALAGDRRAWLTTAATVSTLLPTQMREPLRHSAERWRARHARGSSGD